MTNMIRRVARFPDTHQMRLRSILEDVHQGIIQLPSFHRDWVWDQYRTRAVLESIGERHSIGDIQLVDTDLITTLGERLPWRPRLLDGVPVTAKFKDAPRFFVLDGQQRLTALYKATFDKSPAGYREGGGNSFTRFFFDIEKAVTVGSFLGEAIIAVATDLNGVPVDSEQLRFMESSYQYESGICPATEIFGFTAFEDGHRKFWDAKSRGAVRENAEQNLRAFRSFVVTSFESYSLSAHVIRHAGNVDEIVSHYINLNKHRDDGLAA